jgi:acetate kinase
MSSMRVLVMNCGSSTLKFQIIATQPEGTAPTPGLAQGIVERIGHEATMRYTMDEDVHEEEDTVGDHEEATRRVFDWLESVGTLGTDGFEAVGHRIVHGAHRFVEPTRIDGEVIDALEAIQDLAPLHNGPSLRVIRAARSILGEARPMVAVFDTAFHHTLPPRASQYAIPRDLAVRHHIRRYGFHGLAHRYMMERYAALTETPLDQLKLITLQLGSGCSAAAINAGRSVDTTMGLTPLEGLVMGTRSGDVDPSLPGFLATREGVTLDEVDTWLNTRSGLLGVSGHAADMRDLLRAEAQGHAEAALAIDLFCYRIQKCIGAYLAVLNGAQAIVFGGGMGEHAPAIRSRICADMDWCGLALDEARNASSTGRETRINTDEARIHAYVIPVDEAAVIAHDTATCLGHS